MQLLRKVGGVLLGAIATGAVLGVGAGPGAAQETWPPGFYRRTNESTVRWLSPDGRLMCRVMNNAQMDAFGGEGVVRVVGPKAGFMAGRRDTGICPWPDGIYREQRWQSIWQLLYSVGNNRYYCNITTRQQLNAYDLLDEATSPLVMTVPNTSRLGWRRTWRGDCVWPEAGDGD